MHANRFVLASVAVALAAALAPAADPVVLELAEKATASTGVVTVGDVARVLGADAASRDRVARLDLAEFRAGVPTLTLSRRTVGFRLQLAGLDPSGVVITGATNTLVTASRRAVTADEVTAAARQEILARITAPPGSVTVEPVLVPVVKLPEVFTGDVVTIAARPHTQAVGYGRTQMDVTISAGGEKLLALGVTMDVKSAARPGTPQPGGTALGVAGAGPGTGEVLVRNRSRVTIAWRSGALTVTAVGEAQQDGRLGQTVPVQNVDSKKTITARVTGPGAVDVETGGAP